MRWPSSTTGLAKPWGAIAVDSRADLTHPAVGARLGRAQPTSIQPLTLVVC
jgi:hypothetical protein